MGSNEALSDSERDALKSGNLGDQFQAFFNRMFGSGVDASPKDVTALLALIDDMMPRLMGQIQANYKAEESDLVADTGATAQEVRRRALKGIPSKWAPVMGAVSGFKEKKEAGGIGDVGQLTKAQERRVNRLMRRDNLTRSQAINKVLGVE